MSEGESAVTDEELEALTRRIREIRRKQRNAKLAGAAIAFLGLILGFAAQSALSGRVFWIVAGSFLFLGAAAYRWLDPKEDINDIE